jgi:hypothetical protein
MLRKEYDPLPPKGLPIPCSGRLARRSALDSFDPRTWKEFERGVFDEPSLEQEQRVGGEAEKLLSKAMMKQFMRTNNLWMINLQQHRRICGTCRHKVGEDVSESPFGLQLHNSRARSSCLNISFHANHRVDICFECSPVVWKVYNRLKWFFFDDANFAKDLEVLPACIKHGQVVVTEQCNTYFQREYHLKCALRLGIMTQEDLAKYHDGIKILKDNTRLATAIYLEENPKERYNKVFIDYNNELKNG